MQFKTKIPFQMDGVAGDLLLVYTPFSFKLFQDGVQIKKQGITGKFSVRTTDGGTDILRLEKGIDFTFKAKFRGIQKPLEEKLTTAEYIVGGLPILLIFVGGLIGAVFGILGASVSYGYMRTEKNLLLQILISLGIGVICWLLYFAVAFFFLVGTGRI